MTTYSSEDVFRIYYQSQQIPHGPVVDPIIFLGEVGEKLGHQHTETMGVR